MSQPMRISRLTQFLRVLPALAAAGVLAGGLSGCRFSHHQTAQAVTHRAPAPAPVKMIAVDLSKVQPNEAGSVPILEYHDLVTTSKITGYQYPAAAFRKDVDFL